MKLSAKRILGIVYLSILLSVILASCYTEKKAARQVNTALIKHPLVVAKVARDAFPCTTTKQDTVTVTSDTTIYIECPEVNPTPPVDHTDVQPQVTPVKKKTFRVPVTLPLTTRYITKTVKDSAIVTITITEMREVTKKNEQLTAKIERKNKVIIWLSIALAGVAAGIFLKLKFF